MFQAVFDIIRKDMRVDRCFRTALVYAGDLTRSVEADGYSDAVVSAADLLGL